MKEFTPDPDILRRSLEAVMLCPEGMPEILEHKIHALLAEQSARIRFELASEINGILYQMVDNGEIREAKSVRKYEALRALINPWPRYWAGVAEPTDEH